MNHLYTTLQLAERLGTTPAAVRRLIHSHVLDGSNLRGQAGWRIPERSVHSYERATLRAARASG
jgi:excisionase family DNA binding protein